MTIRHRVLLTLISASAMLTPATVHAQTCRAQAIAEAQCTVMALEKFGTDARAAKEAEDAATSGLVAGCSQGEYQMALLSGTGLGQVATERLRLQSGTDAAAVRAACSSAAQAAAR